MDARKIVIAGQSEGGIIAPMVAVENPDIAAIILLAGPGFKGEDILLAQIELIGRAEGRDETSVQRNRHNQEILFHIIKTVAASPDYSILANCSRKCKQIYQIRTSP